MYEQIVTGQIRLIKEDRAAPNLIYVGVTDFPYAESDPKWQVRRLTRSGNIITTEFANKGSFDQIWSNRAALFGAFTPVPNLVSAESMAASFTSDPVNVFFDECGSVQFIWSGMDVADGSVGVEVSDDGVNWCQYGSPEVITDMAGDHVIQLTKLGFWYMRAVYTRGTATAGTIDIIHVLQPRI